METVLCPDVRKIGKKLWEAKVFSLRNFGVLLTVRGESKIKTQDKCLDVISKRGWNIVELSKRGRIEGLVDAHIKELLRHNEETFPSLLALRLAPGLMIQNVKYKPTDYVCMKKGWLTFHVSGYIVKKQKHAVVKKSRSKPANRI